ncbi:MAG: hypothetical protein II328_01595 [Clostridia bacterium]|nr:hypothetical protein [Clostridia bacterium]
MKRLLPLLLLCLVLLPTLVSCRREYVDADPVDPNKLPGIDAPLPNEKTEETLRIYVVGDSTAQTYLTDKGKVQTSSDGKDIMGWGYYLSYFFSENNVEIINLARSGRGTRNYLNTEEYRTLVSDLKEGDWVFIQFAHNDRKTDDYFTAPNLLLEDVDRSCKNEEGTYSYQACLYHHYVKFAQDRGAKPVLLTPIALRDPTTGLADHSLHTEYIAAMRDLAKDCKIPLIDVSVLTEELYRKTVEQGGAEATASFHSFTDESRTERDVTHLSHLGAYTVTELLVGELKNEAKELSKYFAETPKPFDEKMQ